MENVIDLTEYDDDCIFTTSNINNYHHIKRENLLFCEILETCLNLENSTGMLAVINEKLVVCYNGLEDSVKTSEEFEKALKVALVKLNKDPHKKFSHIKRLFNDLSDLKPKKKRVHLITLDKNVKANKLSKLSCNRTKTDQKNNLNTCGKKPKTNEDEIKKNTSSLEFDQRYNIEVIDILNPICEEKGKEAEVIHNGACNLKTCSDLSNLNVPDESVQLNPSSSSNIEKIIDVENNIKISPQSDISETHFHTLHCQENPLNKQTNNDEHKVLQTSQSIESISTNYLDTENEVTLNDKDKLDDIINLSSESEDENKLLIPLKSVEFSLANDSNTLAKIKELEKKIAICKSKIAKLDEQEVCNDSKRSPYMQSHRLKAKIVILYQELCQLTGEHPVRRRQVCIKAIEGHPSGPLKRLETFLNDNIGSDGHPPFPNFREVVKCVLVANKEDNLGWSKAKVMNEARALFSSCGRALQKRRQKREYEDLISMVDTCDEDPADHDPELRAKLEANKQIAIKRELEVLQKFSMMQNQTKVAHEVVILSNSDTDESFPDANTIDNNELIENKDINMKEEKLPDTDSNVIDIDEIKEEPKENIKDIQFRDNIENCAVIDGDRIVIEISDSSDEEQS